MVDDAHALVFSVRGEEVRLSISVWRMKWISSWEPSANPGKLGRLYGSF